MQKEGETILEAKPGCPSLCEKDLFKDHKSDNVTQVKSLSSFEEILVAVLRFESIRIHFDCSMTNILGEDFACIYCR